MSDNKNFKKEFASGVGYTAITKYAGMAISLVISAVLARILSPEDYGVIAIAMVIIAFLSIFSDMGIGPAVIQIQDLDKSELDTIFSFTVYLGIVLGGLFYGASYLVADWYNDERLVTVCQLLSLNLAFASFNIVPNGILLRNRRFRFIAIRTLSIQIVLGVMSVIAALAGIGLYALLINPVIGSIVIFVVNYHQYPRNFYFILKKSPIKRVASYSIYQFLFSIQNYFTRNLDTLLIGKYIGMSNLGFYQKSYQLIGLPVGNIGHVVSPVLHPIMAQYQDDLIFQRDKYTKVLSILAMIGMPLSVFLCFTGAELITIVYGDQWGNAIPVFQILSLTVGLQIMGATGGSIYQATNNTKFMFYMGLFCTMVNICGILFGIFILRTIEGVAWMLVFTFTILAPVTYWLQYKYVFKSSVSLLIRPLLPAFIYSFILFLFLGSLYYLLSDCNVFFSLFVKTAIFIVCLSYALNRHKVINLSSIYKRVISKCH